MFKTTTVTGSWGDDRIDLDEPTVWLYARRGDDHVTIRYTATVEEAYLDEGNDYFRSEHWVGVVDAGPGNDRLHIERGADEVLGGSGHDHVFLDEGARKVSLHAGNDTLEAPGGADTVHAGKGHDEVSIGTGARKVTLGHGDDMLEATGRFGTISGGGGDDSVSVTGEAECIGLGKGDDHLALHGWSGEVYGGQGDDHLSVDFDAGQVDIALGTKGFVFYHRFTGEEMVVRDFETIEFADRTLTAAELEALCAPDDGMPAIQVAGYTQIVTVNDPTPTVSAMWDRVIQRAVIESDDPTGPTMASRAYAMLHTAMYDAWSAYDSVAVHVSFDVEGDNLELSGFDEDKQKAMSYAALKVLQDLFPGQDALYSQVMVERYGYSMEDDGSLAAQVGIDAAEDLLAARHADGANQLGGYADTTGYTPYNANPLAVRDITRWTPESIPIDPEDATPEQRFLTPQWELVESFGLAEDGTWQTDFSGLLPAAPKSFFTEAFEGSTLDIAAQTITLAAPLSLDGVDYAAGETIPVSRALIGTVIEQAFIQQAEDVVAFSSTLTDEQKIIAEFWEDGGGTSYPPGTSMTFGQFVSARDGHTIDEDAKMFLALGNAMMDSGIAAWHSKVEYDYARPVRVIRDLGELGLIGEWGIDEVTGEEGWVVEAFAGFDEDGYGYGTKWVLAENFTTFQRPGGHPSPPFAEYVSGHSTFSAAGAEVLMQVTGSDVFGGHVNFAPGTIQFEYGVPHEPVTLFWDTFSDFSAESGLSRRYGGIHFEDGDMEGRVLGRSVGASAFEMAQRFIDGTATDADRPFYSEPPFAGDTILEG